MSLRVFLGKKMILSDFTGTEKEFSSNANSVFIRKTLVNRGRVGTKLQDCKWPTAALKKFM